MPTLLLRRSQRSQLVKLFFNSTPTSVLCQIGEFGCGPRGLDTGHEDKRKQGRKFVDEIFICALRRKPGARPPLDLFFGEHRTSPFVICLPVRLSFAKLEMAEG